MPASDSTHRTVFAVLVTSLLLLVALLVAPIVTVWQRDRLADQLAKKIADAADTDVRVPLRQLADLGESAIAPLVAAASSERANVSAIARRILSEKWAVWKTAAMSPASRDSTTAHLMATLAAALASRVHEFGPTGQYWAETLALDMIEFANHLPAGYSRPLLTDCDRILSAVPPRGPRLRTLADTTAPTIRDAHSVPSSLLPKLESLTQLSEKTLDDERPPSVLAFRGSGVLQPVEPTAPTVAPQSPASHWSPMWTNRARNPRSPQPSQARVPIETPAKKPPAVGLVSDVVDIPSPQNMQERAAELRQSSSEALQGKLRAATFYDAGVIRAVLRERGYPDAELVLLQRLASPRVADRLRLVEEVSVLPATAARRWLRWLLEDKNADVRLRALTALGTTNAPDLNKLARELAATDEDPRVARLANRLLKRVR